MSRSQRQDEIRPLEEIERIHILACPGEDKGKQETGSEETEHWGYVAVS